MNTPNDPWPNPSLKASPQDADKQPLSLSLVLIIADARKSTRVIEVGRDQTYAASPEVLTSLPGQLHRLIRDVEADALRGMNQLLAQLVQPEPEPPATPVPKPALEPVLRLVPSATGMQMVLVTEAEDAPATDDYLLPLNLPLTDTPPVLTSSASECPVGGE